MYETEIMDEVMCIPTLYSRSRWSLKSWTDNFPSILSVDNCADYDHATSSGYLIQARIYWEDDNQYDVNCIYSIMYIIAWYKS